MNDVRNWFFAWFKRHQSLNPHNGWRAFEDAGGALMHLTYINAFSEQKVTEQDADFASSRMARDGELWPTNHLARILTIVSQRISAQAAAQEVIRRRKESEEREASQGEWLQARDKFRSLPGNEREARLASIRARYPQIAIASRHFVERFAVGEWQGVKLPEPEPMPKIEASATVEPIHPTPAEFDDQITPSQSEFLDALTPEQRETFEAMTRARRREILAPHAKAFDRSLMRMMIGELRPRRSATTTVSALDPEAILAT